MANLRPEDPGSQVPTVSPETSIPNNYLTTKANPQETGGQVGQALEGFGQKTAGVGQDAFDIAQSQQGLANEHAATMADYQNGITGGVIYDKYKTLTGLAAANAAPAYIQQMVDNSQKIRGSLTNPEAQKAYDALTTRNMMYRIQDMNNYAATQTREAYKQGKLDSMNLQIQQASQMAVAGNDQAFGHTMGGVIGTMNDLFQQYTYPTLQASVGKDGRLSYDTSTEIGKEAQASYDVYYQQNMDKLWTQRIDAIVSDKSDQGGYINADKVLDRAHDTKSISEDTYNKLSKQLREPVMTNQAFKAANDSILSVMSGLKAPVTQPGGTNSLTDAFIQQESSGGKTSTNLGQVQPDTWQRFAKPGEDINNPKDNTAVTSRYIDYLSALPSVQGDVARIAVGYFSGEHNISAPGSTTPWITDKADKNGKLTSAYVTDILGRTSQGGIPGISNPDPDIDRLYRNKTAIMDQAAELYRKQNPTADLQGEERARQYAATQVDKQISGYVYSAQADVNYIADLMLPGPDGKTRVTDVSQILNDPVSRVIYSRALKVEPLKVNTLVNGMTALNARGRADGYGQVFPQILRAAMGGGIGNVADLGKYINQTDPANSPLTNSGVNELASIIKDAQDPQKKAALQKQVTTLNSVLDGTFHNMLNVVNQDKVSRYMLNALKIMQADDAFNADPANKTKVNYWDKNIAGGNNPNWIGNYMEPFYSQAARDKDMKDAMTNSIVDVGKIYSDIFSGTHQGATTLTPHKFDASGINSYEDLKRNASKMSQEEYLTLAQQRGWLH